MLKKLRLRLQRYQQLVLGSVAEFSHKAAQQQFHPDLSPAGWHLGHCVYTEQYWIDEVARRQPLAAELRTLYVPEYAPKPERGNRLPTREKLLAWAQEQQRLNLDKIEQLYTQKQSSRLLRRGYLIDFLIQHYAQHYETLCQIKVQQHQQLAANYRVNKPLHGNTITPDLYVLPAGIYEVGSTQSDRAYDNEHDRHQVKLAGCNLAQQPVSNAQYLAFMRAGGYEEAGFWSDNGWRWQQKNNIVRPDHWCQDADGRWYSIGIDGPADLPASGAVSGLSYYEAEACARWLGGRLPHEHEWETALRQGGLQKTGQAWEWCRNPLFPYPGFAAFPYDGYSMPYFDDAHFVMRGGSRYTQRVIKRPSFRNYFEADKRHQFAGLRVAFD
ncbi:MAG: SUMF1/EgtB/PvdO family nonheme iron enzyme [Gammaproteobacteria bacterium]